MTNIALLENGPRGFLSNYTTILTSLRYLSKKNNISPENIYISSEMFSLYGNPKEWFDENKVVDINNNNYVYHDSKIGFDLSLWPTYKELDLLEYINYIPFNNRIKKLLSKDKKNYSNTLGIHYRGTDNRTNGHTDFIPLENILYSASEELNKNFYDSIFVCTDEEGIVNIIIEYFLKNHNFTNILYFDHIRTSGSNALHFSKYSQEQKIVLGDQVLIDSTTLSKCKTIIGKTSNIINYARILNPSLEVLYQDFQSKTLYGNMNNTFSQIRTSDIQPFIFNWKNQFEKTYVIEDSLRKIFGEVTVINSDEENTKPEWINICEESYFTAQFVKALELFKSDKKVLMHVQGDTVYDNYEELVKDAKKHYSSYEWGVYAPDVTNVWYTSENSDIDGIDSEDPGIKMVACTDETVWFIHRDIIDDFYKRGLQQIMTPDKMKMGWGWDLVMNSISFLQGRPVIRDYNHQVQHDMGTNYNKESASIEMGNLWNNLTPDLQECIHYIKNDKEKLVKYFE
jgi:hypothetical protein